MNEHAKNVLDAYLDTTKLAVPHAVLIEGEWGSGKTYFLRDIYEPARQGQMVANGSHHTPFLYVSLFGVRSADEVEARMYRAVHPNEAVAGALAGTLVQGLAEFFNVKDTAKGAMDDLAKKAIRRMEEFVIVFDDLERMNPEAFGDVMGVINDLLTDRSRRVILLADEAKLETLVGENKWKEQNEKIVGRRARIKADFGSVAEEFIKEMPAGAVKSLFEKEVRRVVDIAETSDVENLRSLRWAMHNAAAFVNCTLGDVDIPEAHTISVMELVVATTLWLRSIKLAPEALERLPGLSMTLAARTLGGSQPAPLEPEMEKAKAFLDTFKTLSVDAPPLDYGFVNDFERSGVLDCAGIKAWIKSQFGFGTDFREAPWRKLWLSHERTLKETDEAIIELHEDLAKRVYVHPGPILHSVGLAIRQAAASDGRLTEGEAVVPFFKRYIDEVADNKLLEGERYDNIAFMSSSYGGLGFHSRDTEEFNEVVSYLNAKISEHSAAELYGRVEAIISRAENGEPEALLDLLGRQDYEFSSSPVMAEFPPERLAAIMTRDMPFLNAGARLLAYRYHQAREEVMVEVPWAREVYKCVLQGLGNWSDPHRTLATDYLNHTIAYYERGRNPDQKIIP